MTNITIKGKFHFAEVAAPLFFIKYCLLLSQIQIAVSLSAVQFERELAAAEVAVPVCFVEYLFLFFWGGVSSSFP